MATHDPAVRIDYDALTDLDLVDLARHGHREAFRHIMQRCNQRLFRIARGVAGDDSEAEDIVQEAYARAFENLDGFRGEAALLTWMTRIVLNEAYGRVRQHRPTATVEEIDSAQASDNRVLHFPARFGSEDPAAAATRAQIRALLERAVDNLPEDFRIVFMMREIEECTVEETALSLGIRAETVKTRLHRARRLLRIALQDTLATTLTEAFPFLGARCDRMTTNMLARLDAGLAAEKIPGSDERTE
ncbi:MAG TPA: RNA polymerase sigma factor [Arenimonas sp.]|uniref:RNA polymerase sigma factor n=1 Tax=Arenimonas sp. TaxID=1872635 RepID=UPI002BD30E1E|nr:RNA polymerase sigma factor [Arenimonas sp.]HMB56556.1 RNA polymerase sigma factor [Arenimonas sp.]